MSQNTKKEVLQKLRNSYAKAGKGYRVELIDQTVELMGYHRKSAIRALHGKSGKVLRMPGLIGRPKEYEPAALLAPLKKI